MNYCKECTFPTERCLCGKSPVEAFELKKIYNLEDFLQYLGVNEDRNAVKINVSFKHKRFRDNEGFAILNLESREMEAIVDSIGEEVRKQIEVIKEKIKRHNEE